MIASADRNCSWADLDLAPNHVAELEASAITPAVAAERGYRTVTTIRELMRLGFSEAQARVPGLEIPLYNVAGELDDHQFKPDAPRVLAGKVVKYERPARRWAGTPLGDDRLLPGGTLDLPPRARPWVMGESIPLLVTEGTKKADSAVSHDRACVSLSGVWNWTEAGVLAALSALPLKGRGLYLAFDSDARRKAGVAEALDRLAWLLTKRGGRVHVIALPEPEPGVKVGLDDYFAGGGSAIDLLYLAVPWDAEAFAARDAPRRWAVPQRTAHGLRVREARRA